MNQKVTETSILLELNQGYLDDGITVGVTQTATVLPGFVMGPIELTDIFIVVNAEEQINLTLAEAIKVHEALGKAIDAFKVGPAEVNPFGG